MSKNILIIDILKGARKKNSIALLKKERPGTALKMRSDIYCLYLNYYCTHQSGFPGGGNNPIHGPRNISKGTCSCGRTYKDIKKGDIIVFKKPGYKDIIIHRVYSIENDLIKTKGITGISIHGLYEKKMYPEKLSCSSGNLQPD